MSKEGGFWSRLRGSRIFGILALYLGAAWVILEATVLLRDALELPDWVAPVAVILLAAGLLIVLATAWVQSHPLVRRRAAEEEVPHSWELDLKEAVRAVREGDVPHLTWARVLLGGAVAFSLLFGAAGLYILIQDRGRSFTPPPAVAEEAAPALAVLPFSVRGPDMEIWREGLVDLLSTSLDGVGGLRTIDSRTVLARWTERIPAGQTADLATSLAVARETGARHALVGTALSSGGELVLSARVYDVGSAAMLRQARVAGDPEEVVALVDRFAIEILPAILEESGTGAERLDLAAVTTESVEALKAFLRGEAAYRRGRFVDASVQYERAVAEDSLFALAWHRLGQARGWADALETDAVRAARERAAALADRLPRRESLRARAALAVQQGSARMRDSLERAVRIYPDDADMWFLLGETYFHVGLPVGPEERAEPFARAIQLDPGFAPYHVHHVDYAFHIEPDSAEVGRRVERYFEVSDDPYQQRVFRTAFDLAFGADSAFAAGLERVLSEDERFAQFVMTRLNVHPRLWPRQREVLEAILEQGSGRLAEIARIQLGVRHVRYRGQVAEGLRHLRAVRDPVAFYCELASESYAARVVPDTAVRPLLVPAALDRMPMEPWWGRLCAAELALRYGETSAYERLRGELSEIRDGLVAEEDSAQRRDLGQVLQFLTAGTTVVRDGPQAGLRALEALEFVENEGMPAFIRHWQGTLLLDAGRPADAIPYLQSAWTHPLAHYHLGQAYEAVGDRAGDARRAYGFFLEHWEEADPHLQPLVEDARRRLGVLLEAV